MKLRLRRNPSSFRLTLALRFRRSWTRWHLRRTVRAMVRTQRQVELMLRQADSLLLRQKEQELLEEMLQHRLWEMEASQQFRRQQVQHQLPPQTPSSVEQMSHLLGLESGPSTTTRSETPSAS